jgi:hypothetical protein
MKLLRMTNGQWMILVAVVSAALALLIFLRRLAANKVMGFMHEIRDEAGLPPDASLSDFNVPVTRDMMYWIQFDSFLSRFWIVLLAFIVLATWATIAYFPSRAAKACVPATEPEER